MPQIVLDAEAFKALSSDTRLHILKALDARRLTVSEMGRLLDLNKATVFEHLKQLMTADLVKKEDEGRKWVYYRLTWKGKNVLHPENVQFMLLLGTSVLSVGGLVGQLGNMLAWWGSSPTLSESQKASPEGPSPAMAPAEGASGDSAPRGAASDQLQAGAPPEAQSTSGGHEWWNDANVWLFAVLALLLVATAVFTWRVVVERRRERRPLLRRIQALPPPEPDGA